MYSFVQLCNAPVNTLCYQSICNNIRCIKPCFMTACLNTSTILCLVQGVRDLFWLPIEQYQKDGRIAKGLQRGANAFSTSAAMAALELTNRLVQTIQARFMKLYIVHTHINI